MKLLIFPEDIEIYKISKKIVELNEKIEGLECERLQGVIDNNLYLRTLAEDQLREAKAERNKKLEELKNI
ncbi:hypothetical protein [Chryseobacterium sp. FH1]|uniref:hypothetical protein n=1 Tax=Chryseobacterium sp. FH1 TaxID=1233951 RepID=UPI0004E2B7D6|nr:hypothetical protein [Chryseobacterium sp. FH1]KFC19348.1 hypothetical protein IO90_08565 [Chryseobacterium sp. FH1]